MVRSDGPGDIGAAEKAKAMAEVVRCRETTNQQMLRMYEKIYDNLAKQSLFNEAKNLAELIMNLEASGEISELVFNSVISPLSTSFLHSIIEAENSNKK